MADSEKPRGPIAIDSVPWSEDGQGERFAMRYRVLSDTRKDGRKIGIAYEELPPGKQSVPFHYHLLEEEHLIALEGEATLRLGEERHRIKAGDYVGFPAGQRAGHCLVNEGTRAVPLHRDRRPRAERRLRLSRFQQGAGAQARPRDLPRRPAARLLGRRARRRAGETKMKAAFYERNGPADEVLQVAELPMPTPGPGEVLVRVEGLGRQSVGREVARRPAGQDGAAPRVVPHSDGAGVIEAIGAGVDPARVGERVWLWNGAMAAAVRHRRRIHRAAGVAGVRICRTSDRYEAGACLGIPAMTAHRCVFADGPVRGPDRPGDRRRRRGRALCHPARALLGGAKVIATVSGADEGAPMRRRPAPTTSSTTRPRTSRRR